MLRPADVSKQQSVVCMFPLALCSYFLNKNKNTIQCKNRTGARSRVKGLWGVRVARLLKGNIGGQSYGRGIRAMENVE